MQLRNHKTLLFAISGLAASYNLRLNFLLLSQDIKEINCQYFNSSVSSRVCLHFDSVFNLLYSKWNQHKSLYDGVTLGITFSNIFIMHARIFLFSLYLLL